ADGVPALAARAAFLRATSPAARRPPAVRALRATPSTIHAPGPQAHRSTRVRRAAGTTTQPCVPDCQRAIAQDNHRTRFRSRDVQQSGEFAGRNTDRIRLPVARIGTVEITPGRRDRVEARRASGEDV